MRFSDIRYVDPFLRYLRSKSKVVRNRAEFWTFLSSKILLRAPLPKFISTLWGCLAARRLVVSWSYYHYPKVVDVNTLNFKPNFKCSPLIFFLGGRHRPRLLCALASPGQTLARVKISGASKDRNIVSRKKVDLGGCKLTCATFWIVDQSSPDFFRRTREKSFSITHLSDFRYLDSFRRYSRSKLEVV